jgi:hypothetical protein
MNERIKELWSESAESTIGDSWEEQTKFMERFAELIVRECIDIVSDTRELAIEDGWNVDEAMSTAMFDIEVHFGVGK